MWKERESESRILNEKLKKNNPIVIVVTSKVRVRRIEVELRMMWKVSKHWGWFEVPHLKFWRRIP